MSLTLICYLIFVCVLGNSSEFVEICGKPEEQFAIINSFQFYSIILLYYYLLYLWYSMYSTGNI